MREVGWWVIKSVNNTVRSVQKPRHGVRGARLGVPCSARDVAAPKAAAFPRPLTSVCCVLSCGIRFTRAMLNMLI